LKPIWPNVNTMNRPTCQVTNHSQNGEVRAGPVGKCASSGPMLPRNNPVKLFPLMSGKLEGASHPMSPNPITEKSLLNQSLLKHVVLAITEARCVCSACPTKAEVKFTLEAAFREASAEPPRPATTGVAMDTMDAAAISTN